MPIRERVGIKEPKISWVLREAKTGKIVQASDNYERSKDELEGTTNSSK